MNNQLNESEKFYISKIINNINKNNTKTILNNTKQEIQNSTEQKNVIIMNYGIKLESFKTSTKSSNKKSTSNLLYMINNLPKNNNDVRIVCHSHLMKSIVKQNKSYLNNVSTKIMKNENLWKIFLLNENENEGKKITNENEGKKITIIRHANTFSNILKEKGKAINQHTEKDTKLSIYGIFTSLIQCNLLKDEEENSEILIDSTKGSKQLMNMKSCPNFIYVSVLIRTWMTAICLYLPRMVDDNKKIIDNNFSLIVSPYIKENEFGFDNQPDKIDIQIKNIVIFLEWLISIKDLDFLNKKSIIKDNLNKINTFFDNNGIINIYSYNYEDNTLKSIYFIKRNNTNKKLFSNLITNKVNNNTNKIVNIHIKFITSKQNYKIPSEYYCAILNGVKKPENIDFYSRWCEPFASQYKLLNKNIPTTLFSNRKERTCKSRMENYIAKQKKNKTN